MIDYVVGATGEWLLLEYNTPPCQGRELSMGSDFPLRDTFPSSCNLCGDMQLIWATGMRLGQMCHYRDGTADSHAFWLSTSMPSVSFYILNQHITSYMFMEHYVLFQCFHVSHNV